MLNTLLLNFENIRMMNSKINTGEVLKQYMHWTVAVGWHSATVRWCFVLVSQPTSHE